MADRTVTYDFRANMTNLTGQLAAAGKSVQAFGTQLNALDAKGAKARAGLETIGRGAGIVALGAAAGLAAIVAVTANFDKAMSKVAATGDDARASLDDLRQAAIDAGAATAFSASEAAAGIENLLKAGVSAQDVLGGGLAGALDLAAAGELEVADAAEVAATAMTQFKLSGQDVPHIADLLAAGAGKAQGDVSDLAMALKQSGLVASQMGVSIEETAGTLAAFASAGLLGSDAGTSFRTMLLRLANPTAESAELMSELGINAYDASGQFVGMASVAEQLKVAFEGKTDAERDSALATIFGSDAIRAAAILYDQGSAGVEQWTANVNDAGFAAETAATKLDNLAGDLEALRGSLETALIGAGEGGMGPLRLLVQSITEVVNAFSELPGPAQTGVTATLALTAALAGTVFVSSKVVAGLASARLAMMAMGISATGAARATTIMSRTMGAAAGLSAFAIGTQVADKKIRTLMMTAGLAAAGFAVGGPWGAGIGAAIGLVVGLGTSSESTAGQVDEFTASLDKQTGALTENNRQLAIKSLTDAGAFENAKLLGLGLDLVTDAALGNKDALAIVNDEILRTQTAFDEAAKSGLGDREQLAAADALANQIGEVNGVVDESSEKWRQNAEATGDATDATGGYSSAAGGAGDAAGDAAEQIDELVDSMRKQTTAALAAFDATTAWGQAVADARRQAKTGAQGLDAMTEAGRKNREALSQLAGAWNQQPAAVKNSQAAYKNARQTFIEVATAMGVGREKAKALADALLDVPRQTVANVVVDAGSAYSTIGNVLSKLRSMDGTTVTTYIATRHLPQNNADGGYIAGPGGPTEDRIPAMLSNGEFVMKAAAVQRYGIDAMYAMNEMRLAAGGLVNMTHAKRFANGGGTAGSSGPVGGVPAYLPINDMVNEVDRFRRATGGVVDVLAKWLREELKAAEKRRDALKEDLDAIRDHRNALRDAARSLSDSIASQFSGSDLFSAEGASFESILSGLKTEAGSASQFASLALRLKALGLDGGALQALLETGNLSLLQDFASQGAGQLAAFEAQFNQTQAFAQRAGDNASFVVMGERLARSNALLEEARDEFRKANQYAEKMEKRLEKLENVGEREVRATQDVSRAVRGETDRAGRRS